MINLLRKRPLSVAYDHASNGWHRRMLSLGFCAAYDGLARDGQRRTGRADRVLDIGCGTGALSEAWTRQGGLAVGGTLDLLDPSREMLSLARERMAMYSPRVFHGGAGMHLPQEGPYNVALCAHVLEHLPDPVATLCWIRSRLRPGGVLVLAVSRPHWCTTLVRMRWGGAAWEPHRVCGMLSEGGFASVAIHRFASGPPSRLSCGYLAKA